MAEFPCPFSTDPAPRSAKAIAKRNYVPGKAMSLAHISKSDVEAKPAILLSPNDKPDVMQEWTETWAEYFRRDETKVEAELEVLCSKLRSLAKSLESR